MTLLWIFWHSFPRDIQYWVTLTYTRLGINHTSTSEVTGANSQICLQAGTATPHTEVNLSLSAPDRIQAIFAAMERDTNYAGWDARFIARSSPPTMQLRPRPQTPFEVSIDPYLCNVGGTLHGGAASTILDNLASEALHIAARKGG